MNIKAIIFYTILVAAFTIGNTAKGQDTLTLNKKFTYSVTNNEGAVLDVNQLMELANKDSASEAYTYFNRADNIGFFSYSLGFAGGGLLGYSVVGIILNGASNRYSVLLASGVILTATDLLLVNKWYNKQIEKGVKAYNEAIRKRWAP